jgi:outer membrane cobalamin receptor
MTTYNLYYVKVARTIPGGKNTLGRLSLGYFVGNDKLLVDDSGKKDNSGIMLAWERTMTEWSSKLWLCAEYQGSKSAYGTFNVGAAWKFTDNIAVIAGYDIYNASNLANTFTWQLDIDIR